MWTVGQGLAASIVECMYVRLTFGMQLILVKIVLLSGEDRSRLPCWAHKCGTERRRLGGRTFVLERQPESSSSASCSLTCTQVQNYTVAFTDYSFESVPDMTSSSREAQVWDWLYIGQLFYSTSIAGKVNNIHSLDYLISFR